MHSNATAEGAGGAAEAARPVVAPMEDKPGCGGFGKGACVG